eukprot:11099930-Ditylum_brightwellii.AAC.1
MKICTFLVKQSALDESMALPFVYACTQSPLYNQLHTHSFMISGKAQLIIESFGNVAISSHYHNQLRQVLEDQLAIFKSYYSPLGLDHLI